MCIVLISLSPHLLNLYPIDSQNHSLTTELYKKVFEYKYLLISNVYQIKTQDKNTKNSKE